MHNINYLFSTIITYTHVGIPVVIVSVTGATDDDNDGTYDVMVGGGFSITCTLDCPTNATVTWRQNDAIINSSETMTMPDGFMIMYTRNDNEEIVESVLMKDMAEPSDSAMYQCGTTVQTIQSNDTANIFVYSKCSCTCKILYVLYIIQSCLHILSCLLSIAGLY